MPALILSMVLQPRRLEFPTIFHLFGARGPSAVVRRISEVVVDAIKAQFAGWPSSHVGQEILVRVSPSVAHADAATGVVFRGWKAQVVAAREHIGPCPKFSRSAIAMLPSNRGYGVALEAPATTGVSLAKIGAVVCLDVAAVAPAPPHRQRPISPSRHTQNSETPEAQSGHVLDLAHALLSAKVAY